jgi:hypothetical protein
VSSLFFYHKRSSDKATVFTQRNAVMKSTSPTILCIATQGCRLQGHFVRTKRSNMLYEGDLHRIVNPRLSGRALET